MTFEEKELLVEAATDALDRWGIWAHDPEARTSLRKIVTRLRRELEVEVLA